MAVANQSTPPEILDNEEIQGIQGAIESLEGDPDQFGTDMNVDEVSCHN